MMRNGEAEQNWLKRLQRAAEVLENIAAGFGVSALEGGKLSEVRVILPGRRRGDTLLVLKAFVGEDSYVAFVGGPDPVTALLSWRAKEAGQGVKWRGDEWRPPK